MEEPGEKPKRKDGRKEINNRRLYTFDTISGILFQATLLAGDRKNQLPFPRKTTTASLFFYK